MQLLRKSKRFVILILWTGLLLYAIPQFTAQAQDSASMREVVIVEAVGPVASPLASYIYRGIDEADQRNAEAVIIMLDTPGGNVGTTLEIIQKIRNSDVPVIVFVGPRGAKAASAGLLITLAGHAAAMAPETAIGASSPVGPQGEDLGETLQQKEEQYLSAQARSLAERRGPEAALLAEEAVTKARAVTASEALEVHLIDFVAEDVDDLLAKLDGFQVEVNGRSRTLQTKGASPLTVAMNPLEQILLIITDPNIVFLLMSLGTTLIVIEAWTPGGWAAGTAGVICLGLALYGLGVLPVNWLGIVFVILAFVLFLLDIKAPTHGALTIAAITSLVIGAIILFNQPEIAPFGTLSIPLVIGWSIVLGCIFFFIVFMAVRAQSRQPTTGKEGLIGQIGQVTRDIAPQGSVLIWGERWQAESADGDAILAGKEVEVVAVEGMRLTVRVKK